jgi:hypothetical protein
MKLPRARVLLLPLLLFASFAIAKDNDKTSLPDFVLKAQTVMVIVDPSSGTSLVDPTGNRVAQDDVEKAIMKWGRFKLVMTATEADLVLVVRKGSGKTVTPTIDGPSQNGRPVIIQPTPGDIRIGAQKGNPQDGVSTGTEPNGRNVSPKTETGTADDMFAVYRGTPILSHESPLDGPPVWRYIKKNALRTPDVRAVDEFRKVIENAEKQRKGKP